MFDYDNQRTIINSWTKQNIYNKCISMQNSQDNRCNWFKFYLRSLYINKNMLVTGDGSKVIKQWRIEGDN